MREVEQSVEIKMARPGIPSDIPHRRIVRDVPSPVRLPEPVTTPSKPAEQPVTPNTPTKTPELVPVGRYL